MSDETAASVFWLKGKKTLLRPLELRDVPALYRGINDPENWQYLNSILPKGIGFEEEWVKSKQKPDSANIVVAVCTHDGHIIGTMGLHQIDYINRTAVTGAVIFAAEHHNRGYGTDAKVTLLNFAFNTLGLHLVQSEVIAFNGRSAAYSRKCGYIEEARLRQRFFCGGVWHDKIILSVTREDWLPVWEKYCATA